MKKLACLLLAALFVSGCAGPGASLGGGVVGEAPAPIPDLPPAAEREEPTGREASWAEETEAAYGAYLELLEYVEGAGTVAVSFAFEMEAEPHHSAWGTVEEMARYGGLEIEGGLVLTINGFCQMRRLPNAEPEAAAYIAINLGEGETRTEILRSVWRYQNGVLSEENGIGDRQTALSPEELYEEFPLQYLELPRLKREEILSGRLERRHQEEGVVEITLRLASPDEEEDWPLTDVRVLVDGDRQTVQLWTVEGRGEEILTGALVYSNFGTLEQVLFLDDWEDGPEEGPRDEIPGPDSAAHGAAG